MAISGTAVGVATLGGLLIYSGLRNKNLSQSAVALLRGASPASAASGPTLTGAALTTGVGSDNAPTGSLGGTGSAALETYCLNVLGLTRGGTAAAMGNAQIESGFDPTALNPGEGAIGLFQWELGRRTGLQEYAAKNGMQETDIDAQLGWFKHELETGYLDVYGVLKATPNSQGAARTSAGYFDAMYEKSTGSSRSEREDAAASWFTQLESIAQPAKAN